MKEMKLALNKRRSKKVDLYHFRLTIFNHVKDEKNKVN